MSFNLNPLTGEFNLKSPIFKIRPYLNGSVSIEPSTTEEIIVTGGNFDPDTSFVSSSENVVINSVVVNSDSEAVLNVTSGLVEASYNITAKNGKSQSFGIFSVIVAASDIVPGSTTTWENVSGIAVSTGAFTGTGNSSWTKQATFGSIPAGVDGSLFFTYQSGSGAIMLGLNSDPATDANYTSIDHAIYISSGFNSRYYENGTFGTWSGPTLTPGTVIELRRVSGIIKTYVNDVFYFNFPTTNNAELFFDMSLFSGTWSFNNIKMVLA